MKSIAFIDFSLPNEAAPLRFQLSPSGHIDSTQYSLLEVMNDPRLACLSLAERMQIQNSFVNDMKCRNHYMYRREMASGCLPMSKVLDASFKNERPMVNLASNDYLNLSQHPRVKAAAIEAITKYGVGSGSAPMLTGTTTLHKRVEAKIATFKGTEAAMLNASGWAMNVGVLRALLGPNDAAICDMYAHASLMDGASHSNKYYFKHNDMASLQMALKKAANCVNKLVIVDGVFSMDGDIARLDEIVKIAHSHGAWVVVDEAHADGIIGANGRGTMEHFGLEGQVDLITGTFSKALGSVGGYAAGSRELIDYLHVASRSNMFATSPALPAIAAVDAALDVIADEPLLRHRLAKQADYFREAVEAMGFDVAESATAIIPLIIGNDEKVKEMAARLNQAGILVNPVPYPAVPKRLTRVRISLTAGLTQGHIDRSLMEIERVGLEMGILTAKPMRHSA